MTPGALVCLWYGEKGRDCANAFAKLVQLAEPKHHKGHFAQPRRTQLVIGTTPQEKGYITWRLGSGLLCLASNSPTALSFVRTAASRMSATRMRTCAAAICRHFPLHGVVSCVTLWVRVPAAVVQLLLLLLATGRIRCVTTNRHGSVTVRRAVVAKQTELKNRRRYMMTVPVRAEKRWNTRTPRNKNKNINNITGRYQRHLHPDAPKHRACWSSKHGGRGRLTGAGCRWFL